MNRAKMKLRVTTTVAMLILGIAIPSYASTPVDIANGQLNFGADSGTNQISRIGTGAGVGFTHRYSSVFAGVDAVLSVVAINNLDKDDIAENGADNLLDYVDNRDSVTGKQIDIQIDVKGVSGDTSESGSATLRVDFVAFGTNDPVTLQNISIIVTDIDDNQYVTFSGINAYETSSSPLTALVVTPSSGTYEFKEPADASSIDTDEKYWALVEYASADSVSWTIGAREAGSASFGVSFADATWTAAATRTPITLTAFNLTYDTNGADSGVAPTTQSSTTSSAVVTLAAAPGALAKSNCTLVDGWNTRSDGTGASYLNGNSITLTSNTTLYAKWSCTSPSGSSGAPAPIAPTATPTPVPTLAKTGASEFRALFAMGLVGLGILMIAYVRRPLKG